MGEPLVRTEIDKENNSSLHNSASTNNKLQLASNLSSGKQCVTHQDSWISKKPKISQTESFEQTMASGFKNNSSNKPRTSNLSQGNRRFDNGSAKPRLGIQYLDEDSDDLDQPHHRTNGEQQFWKGKDRAEASGSKETSKSSKNIPQKSLLPQISPQPSTSGENFTPRSKDQRNIENKKRALSLNKKQTAIAHTSDFSSDAEDLSNIAPTTSKAQTKNGRKNTVPARNHSFNGHSNAHRDNLDSLTESDSAQHTVLPRHFRSPVHKRSSQNVADRRTNGETSNANHSSLEEGFFRRPRISVERYRGSPPRNPPHHRRQANGRNDGSFFRSLVQSNPGLFDTEEDEAVIDITRNSPSLRSNHSRRPIDNRELEENSSRNRRFNQGFSPDHQPRRRNNNRVPRQNRDRQSRIRYASPSRRTVSSPARRTVTSPDAAERVRQIQEDEDLARILQAEFDAEAESVAFHINDEDDSDDSSINGIFENNNFDEDGSGNRGIGVDSTSSSEVEEVDVVGSFYRAPHIYRNGGYHQFAGNMPIVRSRGRRGRPRTSRANTMFHLHDLFGWAVGVDFLAENEDNSSDDYEMLWNLTERLGEVVPRGMDKREINRLPTRKFIRSSRNNNYQTDSATSSQTTSTSIKECQVCLSEFENNEILRILPCFHEFHATCIDRWLKNNNTCPVCRAEVNGVNTE